jgi:hypothetical protein
MIPVLRLYSFFIIVTLLHKLLIVALSVHRRHCSFQTYLLLEPDKKIDFCKLQIYAFFSVKFCL